MKKLFIIAAVLLSPLAISAQECQEPPYVEVSGNAKTKILPNKAQIEITLRESDNKGKYTMQELESNLAKALKNAGVDAKKQLSLYQQYITTQKKNKIYQYKTYMLVVSTAEEAQNVMDALVAEEISNSSINKIWSSDHKAISDSLKIVAVQNTLSDAKTLAYGLGQTIGDAIRISYYPSRGGIVRNAYGVGAKMDFSEQVAPTLPQVNFDEIEIEENVTVRFQLKGKVETAKTVK
ncbi:MAG: SIMPL domain-containing protein [Bacteroidales bacterium]